MKKIFILKPIIAIIIFLALHNLACAQSKALSGFYVSPCFDEQEKTFKSNQDIRIYINAPAKTKFNPSITTNIVLYALPNGNSIEKTAGKIMHTGDDWHYDIQHIAGQTRFIRNRVNTFNLVVVYLENDLLSWPAWKKKHSNFRTIITELVDTVYTTFSKYQPELTLSGHSGGGSFVNAYIDKNKEIPDYIKRINFLDSNYGYNDQIGQKIIHWLQRSENNRLCVLAYNDSIALYKGKSFVSPTGGTWYSSKMMIKYVSSFFPLKEYEDDNFLKYYSYNNQIEFLLKKNPERKIFHTEQVELNGFIHTLLSGTEFENQDYQYFGQRVYQQYITSYIPAIKKLKIPARHPSAMTGTEFIKKIEHLSFDEREAYIFKEIVNGNIPSFLRHTTLIEDTLRDMKYQKHILRYEVLSDYLSIGTDNDFCRIPMSPKTAQCIADKFGAVLPTRKIVDDIYNHAVYKIEPITYYPVGRQNEEVHQFLRHNEEIEANLNTASCNLRGLTVGIKKDVIINNKIADVKRPGHVVIYGWHHLNGQAIQPVSNIHIEKYVDYSHGIRLVNSIVILDGIQTEINTILTDRNLYILLSDELMSEEAVHY